MSLLKQTLSENISKLINLYNLDPMAQSHGYGDRLYWGWKVRDFSNATLQGGVHALAIALQLHIVKEQDFVLEVIDKAILAVNRIKDKSNSVVEAYPNEQSFCVTALVAFDILSTIDILGDKITDKKKKTYLSIVKPLIHFIENNDEEHAIISNHLATGVAAIAIWNKFSDVKSTRHQELLDIIYHHQSEEGWFKEYEGADPGYQTLCTYYLGVANRYLQDEKLAQSLNLSLSYLKYFIQPDGSIGGLYGSRNTEVFYPGGLAILAENNPTALAILSHLKTGLKEGVHILPQTIDIGNYIPLLNSYAYGAWMESQMETLVNSEELPYTQSFEKDFVKSGIYLHSNAKYYAVINYKKGGTLKVFDKKTNSLDLEDGGWIAENSDKQWVSTQHVDDSLDFSNREIKAGFYKSNEAYPSPFQFLILRFLSITIFKSNRLGNIFKRVIVKMLMTGKNKIDGYVSRRFEFSPDEIRVYEKVKTPTKYPNYHHGGRFKSIHMASSGYNTQQLLNASRTPNFVAFHIEHED